MFSALPSQTADEPDSTFRATEKKSLGVLVKKGFIYWLKGLTREFETYLPMKMKNGVSSRLLSTSLSCQSAHAGPMQLKSLESRARYGHAALGRWTHPGWVARLEDC